MVSIWSLNERQIVARCQGHHSWVTAVAFDPWRCDEKNYRFGSVGDDCKLLLWDFSVGMLHRPKAVRIHWLWRKDGVGDSDEVSQTQIARHKSSISAQSLSLQRQRTGSVISIPTRIRSDSLRLFYGEPESDEVIYHAVEARSRTAQLPPVMVSPARICLSVVADLTSRGQIWITGADGRADMGLYYYRLRRSTNIHCVGWDLKRTASSPRVRKVRGSMFLPGG